MGEVFESNLKLIEKRNAESGAKHAVNKFADLTPEEFKKYYTGRNIDPKKDGSDLKKWTPPKDSVASSKDWCSLGACTPIKNQAACGSCWAFGGTETLESEYQIAYGALNILSPQQPTSCDTQCAGCDGGNAILAWQYVNKVGGQVSESSYPYTSGAAGVTGACKSIAGMTKLEDIGDDIGYYVSFPSAGIGSEAAMLSAIQEHTLSIAVDASAWSTYSSGIVTGGCGTDLDHNVQITGYNAQGDYWIVRNSWGADWGEDGFIYLKYGSNVCGVADECTFPVPSKVAMDALINSTIV